MSQFRIKKNRKRNIPDGGRIAHHIATKLQDLPTLRQRVDALTGLNADELRAILDDDPAIFLLIVACWGGRDGIEQDFELIGKRAGELKSVLAIWELRKAGYIHWTGTDPTLGDDEAKRKFGGFKLTGRAHMLSTPLSATAKEILADIREGCNRHRKMLIDERRAEAYKLGILPMDKAVAREKIAIAASAQTGMSVERTHAAFENVERNGMMGQNDDGSFWVRHPDGDPDMLLIPDLYNDIGELLN